jgi:hypothetical protein
MIGNMISDHFKGRFEVICDSACGGNQRIPLFGSPDKSRDAVFCNVDMVILPKDKSCVKAIIEIEESDIKPTNLCGKYLTSALSEYLIHSSLNNRRIPLDEATAFIQVLCTDGLAQNSVKDMQLERIEKSISELTRISQFKIKYYKLFFDKKVEFNEMNQKGKDLIGSIESALCRVE